MYVISLFGDKSIPLAGSPKVIDSSIATLTKKLSLCNRSKVIDDKDSGIKTTTKTKTKSLDVDYLFYLSELAFEVELALAKAQEEDSVFRIKSAEDVYHVPDR